MRKILVYLSLAIAISPAGVGADVTAQEIDVQVDPAVLHLLAASDAILIKVLREGREPGLLTNLGIGENSLGTKGSRFQKKRLVYHREYRLGDNLRRVFVYDPSFHSWPGTQPETIVITDASYRPLDWKEVGGSPMFERASFENVEKTGPVLLITREHRHTIPNPKRGIYRFSLNNDTITPTSGVEWLYKDDAERAQYDRWREALRARGQIESRQTN